MKKSTLTLLILLTLIVSALWFLGSWWYYTRLKCGCKPTTSSAAPIAATTSPQTSTAPDQTVNGQAASATPEQTANAMVAGSDDNKENKTDNDPDNDGLSNEEEKQIGTDPLNADTDNDGIPDSEELGADLSSPIDTDKDGIIDALDPDDDNDGLPTLLEGLIGTSALLKDTDGDGLPDKKEVGEEVLKLANQLKELDAAKLDALDTDKDGTINALDIDDDDDGLDTATELSLGTNPLLKDSDGDGLSDSQEIGEFASQAKDSDADGIIDALDNEDNTDSDSDGISDLMEKKLGTNPQKADSDDDGIDDLEEIGADINNPLDSDGNGVINALDADDDGDGLSTNLESTIGTNPLSMDSDEDGITDKTEVGTDLNSPMDSDGDGVIDALDKDAVASVANEANEATEATSSAAKATEVMAAGETSTAMTNEVKGTKEEPQQSEPKENFTVAENTTPAEEKPEKQEKPKNAPENNVQTNTVQTKNAPTKDLQTKTAQNENTPETQTDSSNQATTEIMTPAKGEIPASVRLYFPFRARNPEISPEISRYFHSIAAWTQADRKNTVTITGYTDNVGSKKSNLALALRRVMAIRELLIEAGVPFQQIDVISRGEAEPIADNNTESGRLKNRRVEIRANR